MDHVYLIRVYAPAWTTDIAVDHLDKVFETMNEWASHKGMENSAVSDQKAEDIRRFFHLNKHGTFAMPYEAGKPTVQITRHVVLK